MFKVGNVLQFYSKTSIAIVQLDGTLAVHDRIRFVRDGNTLFEQTIEVIQVEHNKVDSANRGDVIGLKTQNPVNIEDEIFKV